MNTSIITTSDRFEAWLRDLDDICLTETGLSYQDLSDHLFKDWFNDGMTPEDAYYQMMEEEYPGIETPIIYYQEFDTFTDADPGL
jgi:hypothetical protein